MKKKKTSLTLFAVAFVALTAGPANAKGPSVEEIVKRTNEASYYRGKDGRAKVRMTITDKQGRTRSRKFSILRKTEGAPGGAQRFYVYFEAPADVAKTVFLVHKKIDSDDDRWLYLPSLDLVKRIAASDKRTSFVGSDFLYEDVSGRALSEDKHELVKTTDNYYVLKHTPKSPGEVRFSSYTMYVHRKTFLPTKVAYLDKQGKTYRVMTVGRVTTIQGHPTVMEATMEDLSASSKTVMTYEDVKYDIGVPDRVFTERYLRRAPSKYLK